jgi:hypothetical protein
MQYSISDRTVLLKAVKGAAYTCVDGTMHVTGTIAILATAFQLTPDCQFANTNRNAL